MFTVKSLSTTYGGNLYKEEKWKSEDVRWKKKGVYGVKGYGGVRGYGEWIDEKREEGLEVIHFQEEVCFCSKKKLF